MIYSIINRGDKQMTIIERDIESYTSYKEFAQDGLYNCHPNDEQYFKKIIKHYDEIIDSLEKLKSLIK